MWEEK